jgi:hypothetical protein
VIGVRLGFAVWAQGAGGQWKSGGPSCQAPRLKEMIEHADVEVLAQELKKSPDPKEESPQ